MNFIKTVCAIILLLPLPLSANGMFSSQDEVCKWMTYYYINPEPNRVSDVINYMSQNGMLDEKKASPPIFGFLAGIFKMNPSQVLQSIKESKNLPPPHYSIVLLGIWYSGLPNGKTIVIDTIQNNAEQKKNLGYLLSGDSPNLLDIPLKQGAWVLDALWGNFMATGEEEPILKIMSALPWVDVEGNANLMIVGGAANWSLTSNAMQHDRVLEICEKQVQLQPSEISIKLKKIIDRVHKEKKLLAFTN
jgi:hypothetical protein